MSKDVSLNELLDEYHKLGLFGDPEIEIPEKKSLEMILKEIRDIEEDISKLK